MTRLSSAAADARMSLPRVQRVTTFFDDDDDDGGRTVLDGDVSRDERHESRTDLRRAQWNVKMNTPCTFTPTVNTTCNQRYAALAITDPRDALT